MPETLPLINLVSIGGGRVPPDWFPENTLFRLFQQNLEFDHVNGTWPCLRLMLPVDDFPVMIHNGEKMLPIITPKFYTNLEGLKKLNVTRVAHYHLAFPNRSLFGTDKKMPPKFNTDPPDDMASAFYVKGSTVLIKHTALLRGLEFLGVTPLDGLFFAT